MSKYFQWSLVGLIIIASFGLSLSVSLQESAVMDELAHIPAGYGYVRYLDYRLNPEHPPLIKALSALPLLFQKLNFPTQSRDWQTEINGQWALGTQFLYESGNNADQIINWARLAPMLLTLLLILFIYIWASEIVGRWWAFLPTFLFAFSPTVLAHSHYVTTDIAATFGIFVALYYFVKFTLNPSGKRLIYAGIAFGIAQLLKFSAVLLIPFFIFLAIVYAIWKAKNLWFGQNFFGKLLTLVKELFYYLKYVVAVFALGYVLVYAVYFVFTINYPVEKQVSDTTFILTSFANGPDTNLSTCKLNSGVPLARRVRCLAEVNILMAKSKILRPLGEYMLGVLMVMQRSSGGNTGYFLGEVSAAGWWYYFPVVFLLKEPIPSLIIIALAIFIALGGLIRKIFKRELGLKNLSDYIGVSFPEFSMLAFAIFYWLYSIKSPLNIGYRHILPTIPLIYILSTVVLKEWSKNRTYFEGGFFRNLFKFTVQAFKSSAKTALIIILAVWFFLETAFAYPYFLSYFNELGGGIYNGYKSVTDSNYDWGQDLKRLKKFVDNPPAGEKIDKIAIDYFGGGNLKYYLGNKAEDWQSSKNNPKYDEIYWLAVSINNLQGDIGKLRIGQQRKPEDEYRWLQKIKDPYKPDYRVGTTLFVYKLD
ncbi:MAG: glycosyltransferase family 39 protein [Candidatus Wolfebacteria bacterium]|nr:glycosyltransferase family 39 protein [Candidatus Wolfebacteria bacterium]